MSWGSCGCPEPSLSLAGLQAGEGSPVSAASTPLRSQAGQPRLLLSVAKPGRSSEHMTRSARVLGSWECWWGLSGLFLLPVAPSRGRDAPMLQAQGSGWRRSGAVPCRNQGSLHAGLQMTRTLGARGA